MSQMFNYKEVWRTTLEADVADYRSKWEVIFPKEDSYPIENEQQRAVEKFELIHRNERTEHKLIPDKEDKEHMAGQDDETEKNWVIHEQRAIPVHIGNVVVTTEKIN